MMLPGVGAGVTGVTGVLGVLRVVVLIVVVFVVGLALGVKEDEDDFAAPRCMNLRLSVPAESDMAS